MRALSLRTCLLVAGTLAGLGACEPFVGTAYRLDGGGGTDGVRPSIEVSSPVAGEVFTAGETLSALASIGHATEPVSGLAITVAQGEELLTDWTLAEDGTWTWRTTVEGGLGEAVLTVVDSDGDSATARLTWAGNRAPAVQILSPAADAIFTEGRPIPTVAELTDPDVSDPRLLDARWEIGGAVVAQGSPGSDGTLSLSLPGQEVGSYTLVLVGSDGLVEVEDSVLIEVEAAPDTGGDTADP